MWQPLWLLSFMADSTEAELSWKLIIMVCQGFAVVYFCALVCIPVYFTPLLVAGGP